MRPTVGAADPVLPPPPPKQGTPPSRSDGKRTARSDGKGSDGLYNPRIYSTVLFLQAFAVEEADLPPERGPKGQSFSQWVYRQELRKRWKESLLEFSKSVSLVRFKDAYLSQFQGNPERSVEELASLREHFAEFCRAPAAERKSRKTRKTRKRHSVQGVKVLSM